MPIVFSSLGGLGPPEAVHYLDSLFSEVYAAELAATGTTRRTCHLRTLFLQSLLVSLAAATADMAASLTRDAAAPADGLRPLILLIEAPERAAKHPDVPRRGCLAAGYI